MVDDSKGLAVGDPAPDFSAPREGGGTLRLGDLLARRAVVLYFYPKDDTPGCTAESCGFRDRTSAFDAAGAEVVGISGDSVDSHDRFAAKFNLPFALVSDADGAIRRAYGVAPHGLHPSRTTFVIDRQGVIRQVLSSLPTAVQHVDDALAALAGL